jgi:hypothetical protein
MGFGNAKAIGLTKSMGTNCFMLDRFNLRMVDSMIARARELKKNRREAVGGYFAVAAWCFNSGAP